MKPLALPLLLVAVALSIGCSAWRRDNFLRDRAGQHVYAKPLEEVWPAALQLLQEEGYTGREVPGAHVYQTEWKEELAGAVVNYTRYLVEGRASGAGGCTVHFTKVTRSLGGGGGSDPTQRVGPAPEEPRPVGSQTGMALSEQNKASPLAARTSAPVGGSRDLLMEWRLLKRLEPERAASLEAEADGKAPPPPASPPPAL